MTDSQALLAHYHAGKLDDNGMLAMIDALQDEGDERADGYAFIRRWGCVPLNSDFADEVTWFGLTPTQTDDIGDLLLSKLANKTVNFGGLPANPDNRWRDYGSRREALDDLAHAYALLTPAEREQVEELFREHRTPKE